MGSEMCIRDSIYPVDELVWENNNEGALFREDFLTLKDGDAEQWQDILDRLDEGGYNDQTPVAPFIGLAADPGTLWAEIRLGELKAMLYLALEDEEGLARALRDHHPLLLVRRRLGRGALGDQND